MGNDGQGGVMRQFLFYPALCLVAGLVFFSAADSAANALASCTDVRVGSRVAREEVYLALVQWWGRTSDSGDRALSSWKKAAVAMGRFKKGKKLSCEEKNAVLLRRLVKQHPGLNREVVEMILRDDRLQKQRPKSLEAFVSVLGMLASNRVGFRLYYPGMPWHRVRHVEGAAPG